MSVIRAIVMAFACFSAIPMPRVDWSSRNMRFIMAAFPLVGAVIGACLWLWSMLCSVTDAGVLLRAAGLTLLPLAVTGGIHMDGFCDVTDALSSHAAPERKRQILKDPHIGAFAVVGVATYLLAYCALASELPARHLLLLCVVPVVSRCFCGLAAVTARPSSDNGMLATMSSAASARIVRAVLAFVLLGATGVMLWLDLWAGCGVIACAALCLAWTLRVARREFGGLSGDLLGFYVQTSELAMLAGIIVVGKLVA